MVFLDDVILFDFDEDRFDFPPEGEWLRDLLGLFDLGVGKLGDGTELEFTFCS